MRRKQLPSVLFNLRINKETIERKSNTKFLDVYVNENLNWKEHVNLIANKVSKSIGIITKAMQILPFYAIVVYPIFFPCLSLPAIWNHCLGVYVKTIKLP